MARPLRALCVRQSCTSGFAPLHLHAHGVVVGVLLETFSALGMLELRQQSEAFVVNPFVLDRRVLCEQLPAC